MRIISLLITVLISGCSLPAKSDLVDISQLPKLAWANQHWDVVIYKIIDEKLSAFEKAKDWNEFCPGFSKMSRDKKIHAVATLAVAISKFESGYKPNTVYKESNGVYSIGLFQLSYGDSFCPKSAKDGDLKDGRVNINCAVKIMAKYVEKDEVLADGGYVSYGAKPARGMARYWAVIREPDRKRRHHLGEIQAITATACR